MTIARPWQALGVALAAAAQLHIPAAVAAPDEAPDSPAAAAARTAHPSQAQETLDRGIASYKKNALAPAVGALSQALSLGGLDTSATARALYYRGLAYRKQGRAALAISDFNNALFLPNGLTAAERTDAVAARADAYKTAGIPDPGAPETTSASAQASPPAPAAPASVTDAAAAKAPATGTFATAVKPAAPAAASRPAEPPPAASGSAGSSSSIGSFFSNLFSSGSQPSSGAGPASEVTTASTGAPSAVSAWNSATEVDQKRTKAAPATAAPPPQKTAALSPPAASAGASDAPAPLAAHGKYKLQVAAVRSRAEAEKLVQKFVAEHGTKAGGRTPAIEEAVFGNMGTFYRVNVGPFASQSEPDQLCRTMRGSGYDCLVVTH